MNGKTRLRGILVVALTLLSLGACGRNPLAGSKLTSANYDQVTLGMSKAQVQTILGAPTAIDSKALAILKKTTFRYENGKKFAIITFKNDEVDGKDTNLGREP